MTGADLPPTYTQEPSESDAPLSSASDDSFVSAPDGDAPVSGLTNGGAGPQILIVPAADGVHFQKGFLGADGERAAIEGELHIKSADAPFRWRKVSVSLRSVEKAHGREIELAHTEQVLADVPDPSGQQRSSFPFSIPLPADTPQCLHTSRSSLAYTLSATIHPAEEDEAPLCRSFIVHTRRYTSHTHGLHPVPETRMLAEPSRVEVQLPRTTFKAGEAIPIYVTVPTPPPELIVEQGIRLRNLKAELVRSIDIKRAEESQLGDSNFEVLSESEGAGPPPSPSQKMAATPSTSREGVDFISRIGEHGERKVVAISGASCRLHPSRPLRVRLVLHPPSQSPWPDSASQVSEDLYSYDSDTDCATITQSTLLHSVSFQLLVHATFMKMSSRTERISTITIPLNILPPSAPLPEVESSIDEAYHKKHDRPPTRTVRQDDAEVPQYEAGPSGIAGAPPPFEEREAPPPFWSTEAEAEASTSRLPTFLESEREIFVPLADDPSLAPPPPLPLTDAAFDGEGTFFGFSPADQFDGYADVLPQRAMTPPPPLELAARDTDVTGLANMDEGAAMEALGLALEHAADAAGVDVDDHLLPPPPPPPMDDPSDPPPSIDSSDFRAPGGTHVHDSPPSLPVRAQSPHASFGQLTEQPVHGVLSAHDEGESHGHAPPPYRVPDLESEHERVAHPPPYMDLVHQSH